MPITHTHTHTLNLNCLTNKDAWLSLTSLNVQTIKRLMRSTKNTLEYIKHKVSGM